VRWAKFKSSIREGNGSVERTGIFVIKNKPA